MSTTTIPSVPASSAPARRRAGSGLGFAGILRSEWIKLRTVRSTWWSYSVVVVIALGTAAMMASVFSADGPGGSDAMPSSEQAVWVVSAATFGIFFGQLVVAVLGVLVVTGEYSTGMIRSTLTAVPRRLAALWAKAVVLFTATFVVGAVSVIGSFLLAAPILAGKGIHANLLDGAVIVPLLASALYLALLAVFALGLGTMLRSSAGGIATTLGIVLLLPIVLVMIPATWVQDLMPYLISTAGVAMIPAGAPGDIAPWQNLLIVLGWLTVSLVGAALVLRRRDA